MIERKAKPLILGIGTFVAATFGASALANLSDEADELFELTNVDEGLLAITGSDEGDKEGECGEGECGDDDDSGEGECGEGQCGEEDEEEEETEEE